MFHHGRLQKLFNGYHHSWSTIFLVCIGTMVLRCIHELTLSYAKECQETVFQLPSNIHFNSLRDLAKYLSSLSFCPRKRRSDRQLLERSRLFIRSRSHFMDQACRSLVCRRFRCMARSTTRQLHNCQSWHYDFHREQYCWCSR